MQLTLCNGILSQFYNLIRREPVLLWVLVVLALSSYSLMALFMRIGWFFSSLFVHKGVLIIMQGCIRVNEQGL